MVKVEINYRTKEFEITLKVDKEIVEEYGGVKEMEDFLKIKGYLMYGDLLTPELKKEFNMADFDCSEEKTRIVLENSEGKKKLERLLN